MCTEYSSRKNRPTVHVFCRDQEGRRVEKTFSYRPYFFLKKSDINEQRLDEIKSVLRVKEGYTGLKGENLCKLILNLPLNVGLARDFLHSKGIPTWEADVYAFSLRWLIDKELFYLYPYYPLEYPAELVLESRKVVLYLDIEKVGGQIILISFAKGFEAPTTYSSKTFDLTQPDTLCFPNETQMLSAFLEIFQEINPDVIVGWNIHYDLREITKRMNQLHLPYRSLSPMNQISFSRASKKPAPSKHLSKQRKKQIGEPEVIIKGREAFDLAKAYKELFKKELRVPFPEALDVVCRRHLGRGKLPLDISEMEEVWAKRPDYFVEYNKNDVTLLQDLEKEEGAGLGKEGLQILEFFDELRKTAGVRLRDVWYKHRLIDSGLLRISDKRLISAKSLPVSEESYVGALREVEPGIYSNMMMVDFRGFYASLVMKYNISPETIDPFGENIVDAKHRFKKEPKGLMPRLIERLVKKKDEAKLILKKNPSSRTKAYYNALKFLVASSYGQLGYPNSRVYNILCAEGVTLPARKQIGILRDLLNGLGHKVVFLDTDGCAFPFDSSKEAREEFLSFLNSKFEGLELDEADYFRRLIVVAKTRYVGLNEQGEIITKGMSLIRSDVPIYFAEAQERLTKLVLEGKSRQKILDYCKKTVEDMPKQKLSVLGVPKGLKMSLDSYAVKAYHVTAAKRAARELGIKFKIGDKPRILPTCDSQKYIAIRADTILPKTIRVDYSKLVSLLLGVLRPVYRLLEIDDDEVRGKSVQTKLI